MAIFIIPSIASASWWNPFSWFKKQVVQPPVVQVSIPVSATTISVNDKQVEKVIPKKEKQNTQPTTQKKIIPTASTPTVISKSGGGSGGGMSPITLSVPLKCSDYASYFASISSCDYIKQGSSANEDGVEIDHPLYTLCMQCNPVFSSSVPVNNSTPGQVPPKTTGCTSTTGWDSLTGASCQTWTK